ncbi:MAG: amidase [Burkholderiaceae bacterium]|nr:amidase [Burkholderiaceae bacterium]
MSDLHQLDAQQLADGYARGDFTPSEATEAVLAQIGRREPQLGALYAFDAEAAREQAAASSARWRAGAPLSPLDGVPGTLKENIATRGCPMPAGTAATELLPQPADAPPAARWREAGLVLLAKTTMPDWGMLSSGLSSFHQLARNPWDPRFNPGGSSAGAGTAAAAGYGPLHLGTDIGGSIRLPAGWCGLVGLKPSAGRLPIKPPYVGRVAGPMTRSVRDAAWMMALLARPDPEQRDPTALPPADIPWLDLQAERDPAELLRGLRLGLQLDAGWGLPVEPETRNAISAAARTLAAAGATVVEVKPFSTREMMDGLDRFWRMRSWLDFQALPAERRAKVLPYIQRWVEPAAAFGGPQVFHGFSQIAAFRDAALGAIQGLDFVLSPTSPVPSFPAEWAGPTNDPEQPLEHIAFTVPYNMSEQPAVSIHAGFTSSGLPIGLQIAGQRFDDLGVLRLAAVWERLRPAMPAWPMG